MGPHRRPSTRAVTQRRARARHAADSAPKPAAAGATAARLVWTAKHQQNASRSHTRSARPPLPRGRVRRAVRDALEFRPPQRRFELDSRTPRVGPPPLTVLPDALPARLAADVPARHRHQALHVSPIPPVAPVPTHLTRPPISHYHRRRRSWHKFTPGRTHTSFAQLHRSWHIESPTPRRWRTCLILPTSFSRLARASLS